MPPIILAAEGAAERPVAPGVNVPLLLSMLGLERVLDGMRVLSRCVEDAEDSLAESGLVGCFAATAI